MQEDISGFESQPFSFSKLIIKKYPDYDPEREHFKLGDILGIGNYGKILVIQPAIQYVEAFILKPWFGFKKNTICHVSYDLLPNYRKGQYEHKVPDATRSLKWKVGDIVEDCGKIVLLYEENSRQDFYGRVLYPETDSYYSCGICITNPYKIYVNGRQE